MIKRRSRPQVRLRELSIEVEEKDNGEDQEGDDKVPLEDLIEIRRLRKAREGIDVAKLNKGDVQKKKKKRPREEDQGGLKPGASTAKELAEEDEEEDKDLKTRKVVRSNNFTQQTHALDVDKHMMAYIEENMQRRFGKQDEEEEEDEGPADPYAELYRLTAKYKAEQKSAEEGSVTNSLAMLTAIPEVDLGMDVRLKNIEETEKAKRMVAEKRTERKAAADDEEHLAAARFFRGNYKPKSDADIMRDAKLEAMGLPPQEPHRHHNERGQMATDEMVMERFKKRMRK